MSFVTFIVVFVAVMSIAAVLFGVWVVMAVLRFTFRAFFGLVCPAPHFQSAPTLSTLHCARSGCHALNPASARFCRRCGNEMHAYPALRRQAALW